MTAVAQAQFKSVRAGLCPDCGAALPARSAHRATVDCTVCGAAWSTEHPPAPPREAEDPAHLSAEARRAKADA